MMIAQRIAAVCLVFVVAGCAGGGPGDRVGAGPGQSATPSAPVDDPSPVPPSGKPSGGAVPPGDGAPGTPQTVTGVVVAGVEPNCLMLRGPSAVYQLLLKAYGVTRPTVGSKVTVVGTARPDMMTTCQEGTPFVVTEIRPA